LAPPLESHLAGRLMAWVAAGCLLLSVGCSSLTMGHTKKLDLMSPSSSLLFPGMKPKPRSPYQLADGSELPVAGDGSMTMEAYQKIREAKAQNAVVLQVAGDEQPVRLLPLPPPGQKSVFVSELLNQTGVLEALSPIEATVYRPSPESISGIKMNIRFGEDGTVDPASDYGLRPGDRVHVRQIKTTAWESLVEMVLRR
jgi:hypothetical protein